MLEINVRLLWTAKRIGIKGVDGVWKDVSFKFGEDELIEKADLDESLIRFDKVGDWVEFTKQISIICDDVETFFEQKGNLPAGLPACAQFGLPEDIEFLSYNVVF